MKDLVWSDLLREAIATPGILHAGYRAFHRFSVGNQMAAAYQLYMRGMKLSPIASYKSWQEKGRQVRKGEKALSLCMPVSGKKKDKETGEEISYSFFVWRANWFSLDQTDGQEIENEQACSEWDRDKAIETLQIREVAFDELNGNVQGYAVENSIAVSPLAAFPHKTTFHELAHVVLGHTKEAGLTDSESTPRSVKEVEAESVAYILCSILDLPGLDSSRAYIQSWRSEISDSSARKIFACSDKILKAGLPATN